MPAELAEQGHSERERPLLRARAFGLELTVSFEAPGLAPATGPPAGPATRLDMVPAASIEEAWPSAAATRVLEEHIGAGPAARTIDAHPQAGYRLYARHFGLARISPSGAVVEVAPPGAAEPWSWQRFLVGRVLPWTAVLRGHEALHASAVALRGGVVALTGPSGWGKTSLALRLVQRGARFVTDDVLALDRGEHGLLAHPGAGIAAVRPDEAASAAGVGTVLGESGKTYVQIRPVERPLPLRAIVFVGRDDGAAIEPLPAPDPRRLLGATFVTGVRTPERLRNQLDVCAAIARSVPAYLARAGATSDAPELAAAIEEAVA